MKQPSALRVILPRARPIVRRRPHVSPRVEDVRIGEETSRGGEAKRLVVVRERERPRVETLVRERATGSEPSGGAGVASDVDGVDEGGVVSHRAVESLGVDGNLRAALDPVGISRVEGAEGVERVEGSGKVGGVVVTRGVHAKAGEGVGVGS